MAARIKKSNTRESWIWMSEAVRCLKRTGHANLETTWLFHDFVAKFLDHGVCKDFPGHALDLLFGGFAGHAIQIEHEKLSLADVTYFAKSQRRKGMLDRLALRIEDRAFRHDPHMCFHRAHYYSKPSAPTLE